jgi:hypothetical protein
MAGTEAGPTRALLMGRAGLRAGGSITIMAGRAASSTPVSCGQGLWSEISDCICGNVH